MNKFCLYVALSAILIAGLGSASKAQTPTPPQTPTTPPADTTTPPKKQEDETPKEQTKRRRVPQIGPQVGVYFPTSNRARSAFGDSWFNYGVGFRPLRLETKSGTTSLDISIFSSQRSGSQATIIPISGMYKVALGGAKDVEGEDDRGIRPYVGVSLGLYITDLRADKYNVTSGWQGGFGGSALIGATYQHSVFLEARYHLVSEMKTFDLSGLNVSLGARF